MNIKKNDFYRYTPNDWKKYQRHCREGIFCVEEVGGELYLVDTYWGYIHQGVWRHDGRRFILEEVLNTGTLEFICNLDEVDVISEYDTKYYNPTDISRITRQHGCAQSCVYYMLKKGAVKNTDVIASGIREEIRDNNMSIKSLKATNKRLAKTLKDVLDGKVDGVYY